MDEEEERDADRGREMGMAVLGGVAVAAEGGGGDDDDGLMPRPSLNSTLPFVSAYAIK